MIVNHGAPDSTKMWAFSVYPGSSSRLPIGTPASPRASFGNGRVDKEMSPEPPRRIQALRVAIDLPAALQPAERAKLEEWARTCPVALSLATEMQVTMEFAYSG